MQSQLRGATLKRAGDRMPENAVIMVAIYRAMTSAQSRTLSATSGTHNTDSHKGGLSNWCRGLNGKQVLGLSVQMLPLPPFGQFAAHSENKDS